MGQDDSLQKAILSLRATFNRRLGHRDALLQKKKQIETKMIAIREDEDMLQQVRILLQESSTYAREQARRQIEGMVTQALQYIFGGDLEFRVLIEEVRGRAEVDFLVISLYGGEIPVQTRPQDARGGGVVDVISLALRAALLYATHLDGPMILDEPAKHVSEEYSRQVAQFLKELSRAFGRQVIMVTHNHDLASSADCAYLVEMKQGRSHIRTLYGMMDA